MLQAATFGVFLALGAGYLYRIFHRHKQWIPATLPVFEDRSQSYLTPIPPTVHEVVMDEESAGKDTASAIINGNSNVLPNGQS
jgi:hypothetical protein